MDGPGEDLPDGRPSKSVTRFLFRRVPVTTALLLGALVVGLAAQFGTHPIPSFGLSWNGLAEQQRWWSPVTWPLVLVREPLLFWVPVYGVCGVLAERVLGSRRVLGLLAGSTLLGGAVHLANSSPETAMVGVGPFLSCLCGAYLWHWWPRRRGAPWWQSFLAFPATYAALSILGLALYGIFGPFRGGPYFSASYLHAAVLVFGLWRGWAWQRALHRASRSPSSKAAARRRRHERAQVRMGD